MRAHAQNRFAQERLLAGTVVHKEHSIPCRRLGSRGACGGPALPGILDVSQRKGVLQKRCKLTELLRRQLGLRGVFVGRGEHSGGHGGTNRSEIRIVPQGQQGVRIAHVWRRSATPDQVEHGALGQLRWLQGSLSPGRLGSHGDEPDGDEEEGERRSHDECVAPRQPDALSHDDAPLPGIFQVLRSHH